MQWIDFTETILMNKNKMSTLEQYLSEKLNAPSDEGFTWGNVIKGISRSGAVRNEDALTAARNLARNEDERDAALHDENFAIRPLPKNYTGNQIVQLVQSYYKSQGFKYDEKASDLKWWACMFFKHKDGRSLQATLSTYPVHGTDPYNDELLVTTEIHKEEK
jgi:hypothetical protein